MKIRDGKGETSHREVHFYPGMFCQLMLVGFITILCCCVSPPLAGLRITWRAC